MADESFKDALARLQDAVDMYGKNPGWLENGQAMQGMFSLVAHVLSKLEEPKP